MPQPPEEQRPVTVTFVKFWIGMASVIATVMGCFAALKQEIRENSIHVQYSRDLNAVQDKRIDALELSYHSIDTHLQLIVQEIAELKQTRK